jgi:hypothetical protein
MTYETMAPTMVDAALSRSVPQRRSTRPGFRIKGGGAAPHPP